MSGTTAPPDRELVGVIEFARECSVHPRTVRRWIHEGKLPAYRIGRKFHIDRSDLKRAVPWRRAWSS